MLDWLGEQRQIAVLRAAARAIARAVGRTLSNRASRTADLGGPPGTGAFTRTRCRALGS